MNIKPLKPTINPYLQASLVLVLALGFTFTPKASILLLPALLMASFATHPRHLFQKWKASPFIIALTLFFAWSFVSSLWSSETIYGLKSVGLAFLLILCALSLSHYMSQFSAITAERMIKILSLAFTLSLFLLTLSFLVHDWVITILPWLKGNLKYTYSAKIAYKSTAYVIGGLSILISGWFIAKERYLVGTLSLLIASILALASGSTTAFLGIIFGILVLSLSLIWPRFVAWFLGISILFFNLSFPLLLYFEKLSKYGLKIYESHGAKAFSFYHRTVIWEFSFARWLEKPFFGWGAASSRSIPGANQEIKPGAEVLSLHSHNHFLQTGLELGLVGAALYTFILLSILVLINRHLEASLSRATAYGLFTALYIFGSAEHSLWHHWWIACLGLFGCFAVLICFRIETLKSEKFLDLKEG